MHYNLKICNRKIFIALSDAAFLMLVSRHLSFRKIHVRSFCILVFLTLLLSACGNKGPLYLPEVNEPTNTLQNDTEEE